MRESIREAYFKAEQEVVQQRLAYCAQDNDMRQAIFNRSAGWVEALRADSSPTLIENFLTEYGLSTEEGIALMCLAEAYLRVPDEVTMDALIRDKIGTGSWSEHLRHSRSSLVNASTWALMLTGNLLGAKQNSDQFVSDKIGSLVQRLGEPLVRAAVGQAMKVMGAQFVLGRSIDEALDNGKDSIKQGYQYSFDMLGEAAKTESEARAYFSAYSQAINAIAKRADVKGYVHDNPGISIKLSALHSRYEYTQKERVMAELVPRLSALVVLARNANIALNIDAEEADRLDLSLDLIEAVLSNQDLAGWEGFGVVVQAYSKQALPVLQWLDDLATKLKRNIAVRLVKGAYWDSEIKHAQTFGVDVYPVFTRKASTDVSYLACARFLLQEAKHIYPQFATHNAYTLAAVLELAPAEKKFEFQRLHGMGESLHELVRKDTGQRCRIYAPVGVHKDLLAYLVRRLLENGANSSFVNQLMDSAIPTAVLLQDPIAKTESVNGSPHPKIPSATAIYAPERINSRGLNINNTLHARWIEDNMSAFAQHEWQGQPLVANHESTHAATAIVNPANHDDCVGHMSFASQATVAKAMSNASTAFESWNELAIEVRADILDRIAELYEQHTPELMALLVREAGKNRLDAILEIREAVDFCRYYAQQARKQAETPDASQGEGVGVFVCVSPWNFPLAIFTGQIVAALVVGNTVVAKPAEQTSLIAVRAVEFMIEAGVPDTVISLLPGEGSVIGAALVSDERTAGVCFTGSTATAIHIDRGLAGRGNARAPLIAETGGINAMIVDSTALPQQVVTDVVASAFQSAGQRCSALRVMFVQEDIYDGIMEMLIGALEKVSVGDPWKAETDIGPVINQAAQQMIVDYCDQAKQDGRLLYQLPLPETDKPSYFVAPSIIKLNDFAELTREIFGPVLHVLTFKALELDTVVDKINASGYRLTLGVHSRVGSRIDRISGRAEIGNIYINRNQIGAVVGTQPFGGEVLSGTGPKAGGEHYLPRFMHHADDAQVQAEGERYTTSSNKGLIDYAKQLGSVTQAQARWATQKTLWLEKVQTVITALPNDLSLQCQPIVQQVTELMQTEGELPGPTGERNTIALYPRGQVLCVAAGDALTLLKQLLTALATGNAALLVADDLPFSRDLQQALAVAEIDAELILPLPALAPDELSGLDALSMVVADGDVDEATLRAWRVALSQREGARLPLVSLAEKPVRFMTERVISVDTTATGGNTSLLTL